MHTFAERTLAASALAAPLALGLSGIASADNYAAHLASAGPEGATEG